MAEIPIQRKEGRNIWPILLGLLALLIILWFIFGRERGRTTAAATDTTTTVTSAGTVPAAAAGATSDTGAAGSMAGASGTGAVADYERFVSVKDATRDENRQHEFTAGGIRRLADALASLGASGDQLTTMRTQADSLQSSSPNSTKHADMARAAFLAAADAFDAIKSTDATRVRTAAEAVKPGPHLLEQKDGIQAFFDAAGAALRRAPRAGT